MKKIICLVLVFTMMLTACSKWEVEIFEPTKPSGEAVEEVVPDVPQEEILEEEPEEVTEVVPIPEEESGIEIPSEDFSFEKPEILYPEFLTEELEVSPAFKSAMEKPSVIVYSEEPITDCLAATNFVEAFEKGEYAEFYYYSFTYADFDDTYRLFCQHLTTKDKLVYNNSAYVYDWEGNFELNEKTVHNFVDINEYGYFELSWEWGDFTYYKVISDFALYENEAKHRALREKYIDPIFTITVSPREFTSVSEISDDLVWLFEDIYNHENENDPWAEYGDNWPVADMVELLNRYFYGVTKEMIISDMPKNYDPETGTIYYPGGRGGVPPKIRVMKSSQIGNLLTLNYVLYHSESGEINPNIEVILEIRLLEDGSFRYLSQYVAERGNG